MRIVLRIGFGLLIMTTMLALAAGLVGRLLPPSDTLLLKLPGKFSPGIYLLDVGHRLLYPVDDRETVAYALDPADHDWAAYADNPGGNWDVYRLNLFTGESHRLTDSPGYDGQAAWSADGQWLALLSDRGGRTNIFGIAVNGGLAKELSRGLDLKSDLAWSPDGKRIIFGTRDSNGTVNLYVTGTACLTENRRCPDNVRQLTSSGRGDYLPAWSPDGHWIAFLSDRGGHTDVYIVDTTCLDTTAGCIQQNARQLTHGVRATQALSWSRDGQTLRFVAEFTNHPVLYSIPFDCDLHPGGCVLQTLFTTTG